MIERTLTLAQKLGGLLPGWPLPEPVASITVAQVQLDSRKLHRGDVFFALAGQGRHGRDYIDRALAAEAAAVIEEVADIEAFGIYWRDSTPIIKIPGLSAHVSAIADRFYLSPSKKVCVVGVTGTNGKSSCVGLMSEIWRLLGRQAGLIGTLGYGLDSASLVYTGLTTPDAVSCQRILAELKRAGASHVAMEVSSHGIDQGRVAAIDFAINILTNITHDHLDYHKTFERYVSTKTGFTVDAARDACIVNFDDPNCRNLIDNWSSAKRLVSYSVLDASADVSVTSCAYSGTGITARIKTPWGTGVLRSRLMGQFNLSNLLSVISALCVAGESLPAVLRTISSVNAVAGRMQKIVLAKGVARHVYVDFAHTPDALAQAIEAIRLHCDGKLWVVFGCGGDRDMEKRAPMGKVVSHLADYAVVTSDNPRSEDPEIIAQSILVGMRNGAKVKVILDRQSAITYALTEAGVGDVVLIAGKGHEKRQIIGDQQLPFDDCEVARRVLQTLANVELSVAGGDHEA